MNDAFSSLTFKFLEILLESLFWLIGLDMTTLSYLTNFPRNDKVQILLTDTIYMPPDFKNLMGTKEELLMTAPTVQETQTRRDYKRISVATTRSLQITWQPIT